MKIDRLSGYNPLRGLDLPGFVNMMEHGERGFYSDLMWLYRLVLRRNGAARAVRRKLTSAIGKLDWNIKIPDKLQGERKAAAERQQAELRAALDRVENFRDALRHLAFADILGFAHCEKIYARTAPNPWEIRELRVVPQYLMCRDGLFARWEYNAEARDTNRGTPIDPQHWIFREVDDPAAEIFTLAHLKMSTTDADWDQFCDTYAVNPLFIEMPPNVPREKEADYQATAEAIVSDGRGALPNGAKIHTVSPGGAGESVFTERLRYYREEIVIAGTGGILTTLDGNTGIGKGPADNHDDAWLDIAAAIGMSISETLQEQFCAPIIERLFPGQEILAYFELDKPTPQMEPGQVFVDAKAATEAGYRIAAEEISEKSGYTVTEQAPPAASSISIPTTTQAPGGAPADPAPAAAPETQTPGVDKPAEVPNPPPAEPPPAANPPVVPPAPETPQQSSAGEAKPSLVQAALAEDLDLESRWLAPVADLFAEIEAMLNDPAIPLDEIAAKIEQAAAAMPELLGKLDVDALARALESATGPAAVEGLADGLRAKTKPRVSATP